MLNWDFVDGIELQCVFSIRISIMDGNLSGFSDTVPKVDIVSELKKISQFKQN